jgi:hypothetical protein
VVAWKLPSTVIGTGVPNVPTSVEKESFVGNPENLPITKQQKDLA